MRIKLQTLEDEDGLRVLEGSLVEDGACDERKKSKDELKFQQNIFISHTLLDGDVLVEGGELCVVFTVLTGAASLSPSPPFSSSSSSS